MQINEFDVMVVGQGLAGSVMVNQLLFEGKKVAVIENDHRHAASKAAIGIHNPLIIKRLRKSWRAKEFIENSILFYNRCEEKMKTILRSDMEIHRIFASPEEEKAWDEKSKLLAWEDYIENSSLRILKKEFNTGKVNMSGWLDVPKFIEFTKNLVLKENAFFNSKFNYTELIIEEKLVKYQNIHSKAIIFCEGYKLLDNPFFSSLPLQQVKGEILVIEDENLNTDKILKAPVYIVPIGKNQYKVGATFEWENFNESTTNKAQNELLSKIKPFTSEKLKVITQVGGVRPTVSDRRPLIGRHSDYNNVYVFNGLGTRGVSLGPYFSKELCDLIFHNYPLNEEVDIQRFN